MNLVQRLMVIGVTLPLLGGGFYLEDGPPSANPDPKAKGAILVTRFAGCHEPHKATLKAFAEGLVNGQRKTIALEPEALATPGMYAIRRTWPAEGSWVLRLEGRYAAVSAVTSTVVKLEGESFTRKGAILQPGLVEMSVVDAMLR